MSILLVSSFCHSTDGIDNRDKLSHVKLVKTMQDSLTNYHPKYVLKSTCVLMSLSLGAIGILFVILPFSCHTHIF